jgi:hypothetical protein
MKHMVRTKKELEAAKLCTYIPWHIQQICSSPIAGHSSILDLLSWFRMAIIIIISDEQPPTHDFGPTIVLWKQLQKNTRQIHNQNREKGVRNEL